MSKVLAQSAAYPIASGPGSVGPFALPAGATGAQLTLQRTGLPAGAPLLIVTAMLSFDGGVTFAQAGAGEMQGGALTRPDGTAAVSSTLAFNWTGSPTHLRIDVQSAASFSAGFSVEALP